MVTEYPVQRETLDAHVLALKERIGSLVAENVRLLKENDVLVEAVNRDVDMTCGCLKCCNARETMMRIKEMRVC
jgi:regulator of replication initiation timing